MNWKRRRLGLALLAAIIGTMAAPGLAGPADDSSQLSADFKQRATALAEEYIKAVSDAKDPKSGLTVIIPSALVIGVLGQTQRASELLASALDIAKALPTDAQTSDTRYDRLAEIGKVAAGLGLVDQSMEAYSAAIEPRRKGTEFDPPPWQPVKIVASHLLTFGDVDEATRLLQQISDPLERWKATETLIAPAVWSDRTDWALAASRAAPSTYNRSLALGSVGQVLALKGQFEAAVEIAEEMRTLADAEGGYRLGSQAVWSEAAILQTVCREMIEQEMFDRAFEVAKRMPQVGEPTRNLIEVAVLLGKSGELNLAMSLARLIDNAYWRSQALKELAVIGTPLMPPQPPPEISPLGRPLPPGLADGMLNDSLDAAFSIRDPALRLPALAGLIQPLVHFGLKESAVRVLETVKNIVPFIPLREQVFNLITVADGYRQLQEPDAAKQAVEAAIDALRSQTVSAFRPIWMGEMFPYLVNRLVEMKEKEKTLDLLEEAWQSAKRLPPETTPQGISLPRPLPIYVRELVLIAVPEGFPRDLLPYTPWPRSGTGWRPPTPITSPSQASRSLN